MSPTTGASVSELTVNAGLRWEYELADHGAYGRLVNLDIAPGFARGRAGAGQQIRAVPTRYPTAGISQPRVGIVLAPVAGVLHGRARRLRRLLRHLRLPVDRDADGAAVAAVEEPERAEQRGESADAGERVQRVAWRHANTFAVDPNFRVGYAQNWQLSMQRDLPRRAGR